MKKLSTFMAAALAFGAGSLIKTQVVFADASTTEAQMHGVIRDKGANEPAVGATVVATSPALQGEQVVITDDTGQYFITALPPGVYTLTVYYNDVTYTRSNVLLQVGQDIVVNVSVNSATNKTKGEVIEIQGKAPIIDQGSTKTGLTVTSDFTNNIPTGRTFGAVIGSSAGAQSDTYGVSFSGSTSVENTYIVEGINTTDSAYGLQSTNLPNEFVSETEIITGGYNAEYGRATGGIVNVITKQGSNEFHGSVFGYYEPASFIAAAKTIPHAGSSVDATINPGNVYDFGAEIGGPIIKDKLWFHIGFDPEVADSSLVRKVSSEVDKNNDGIPDVDANGNPILVPVSQSTENGNLKTYNFTGKINGAIDQNNQFQVSAFGNPQRQLLNLDPAGLFPAGITNAPDNNQVNLKKGAWDISAKWTSKLNGGKTQIDAVAGFHRQYSDTTAVNAAGNEAQVWYNYTRSLNDFADLEGSQISSACQDGGPHDPYPKIVNCPISQYAESGQGNLQDSQNDRISASLSITQRVKFAGYHTFKAGVDYEGSGYALKSNSTGGVWYYERFQNGLSPNGSTIPGAPGYWYEAGYSHVVRNLTAAEAMNPSTVQLAQGQEICPGSTAICDQVSSLDTNAEDRSIGAFLQDSWQIVPNFTLNLGVRYENQNAGIPTQEQGLVESDGIVVGSSGFNLNNWAPRIGFVWDPTQEGRAKIFGHYGRFYENVPMDLNARSFGGEIDSNYYINYHQLQPGQQGYDPNCNVDHTPGLNIGSVLAKCSDTAGLNLSGGGNAEYVTPGLNGQYMNEYIVGAEYEVLPDVKVAINYIHRDLPSVIEDILTDDGEYIITNPGQNLDSQAATLQSQANAEMMSTDPQTKLRGEQDAYYASQMLRVKTFDPPSRNYDGVQLKLEQRPTKNSLILASYTYSKEQGNYPGLFSTETGQLDPNITSEYDLPAALANRYGAMGLDRPHVLKLDAFYRFDLRKAGLLTTGLGANAQSGIPYNALGAYPHYGPGESYLLPRGSAARAPMTSQVDIHISYGYRLTKTTTLEAFFNLFNLFNEQQQYTVDENYTFSYANPIVGGDMNDLKHLKALNGNYVETAVTPVLNPNYLHTTSYLQNPRTWQFGFRLTF